MNRRAALRGGAFLALFIVTFVGGVYVDQACPDYVPYFGHRSVGSVDLTELQQAVRLVQADYVDSSKVDSAKLSHSTVQGLISGLGDPFSAYFDPTQYKKLQQSYQGLYSGIGIYLSFTTGYPVITGTVPGSPAAAAGLQAGDQIVKVGDKDMKGVTSDQATTLIQGPDGTKVTMEISRAAETFSVTIARAEIHVPTVRSTEIGNQVLYVRIYQFGAQTETSTALASALSTGLAGKTGVGPAQRGAPPRGAGWGGDLRQGLGSAGLRACGWGGHPPDDQAVVPSQRPNDRPQ